MSEYEAGDDTCRMPDCDRPTGVEDGTYRDRSFCSPRCDVKHDHLKADARDARRGDCR